MLNANDFLNAILSNGGIPNVRAVIADAYSTERDAQFSLKWSGVNSLNNCLYSEKTITVGKRTMLARERRYQVCKTNGENFFHLFNIFNLKCGVEGSMLTSRSA